MAASRQDVIDEFLSDSDTDERLLAVVEQFGEAISKLNPQPAPVEFRGWKFTVSSRDRDGRIATVDAQPL